MKRHELINLLSSYDDDCEVFCVVEDSDWIWNGKNSVEVTTAATESITIQLVQQQPDGSILIGRRY